VIALAFAFAWIVGWLIVAAVWPRGRASAMALRAVLATGVGFGATSLLAFVVLVGGNGLTTGRVIAAELAVVVVLAAVVRRRRRRDIAPTLEPRDGAAAGAAPRWASALVVLACVAAAVPFVLATLRDPHGIADAVSIWNLRARLLFDSGVHWRNAFAPELAITHPDYPLLVPLVVVRTWHWLGEAPTVVPAIVGGVFTFGTVALLWAALRALGASASGLLAAAALLGFPAFIATGSAQLADVPLAFFALASCVLLAANDRWRPAGWSLVGLAGLLLGLAAWTKNEGLLLLVVVPATYVLSHARLGWLANAKVLAVLAVGALPALLPLLVFKTTLVQPNDLVVQVAGGHAADRVLDGERWTMIATALCREAWASGPVMLVAVVVWWSWRVRRCTFPLAVAATMLAGYFVVYLVASRSLEWHLATSAQRLLLQLLPTALFGVFLPPAGPLRAVPNEAPLATGAPRTS